MRKVIITLCFLFVAFVAQAGRISGINIQSSGEAILVFVDGEQICTPTETCFIANYSGRHRIISNETSLRRSADLLAIHKDKNRFT